MEFSIEHSSRFDEEAESKDILNMKEIKVDGVRKRIDMEFAKNPDNRDVFYVVKDEEWLKKSGTVCPMCRRRIDLDSELVTRGNDYTGTENTLEQIIECSFKDCQACWSEVYVLRSYIILDNGLKKMTSKDFKHILYEELLPQHGLEGVLKIPGVRKLVADHFKDDVKDTWIEQQEQERKD